LLIRQLTFAVVTVVTIVAVVVVVVVADFDVATQFDHLPHNNCRQLI